MEPRKNSPLEEDRNDFANQPGLSSHSRENDENDTRNVAYDLEDDDLDDDELKESDFDFDDDEEEEYDQEDDE